MHPSDERRQQRPKSSPQSTPRTPPRSKRPPPSPSLLYTLRSSTPFASSRSSPNLKSPPPPSSPTNRPHRRPIALGRPLFRAFAPLRPHASPPSRLKELVLPCPFAPFAPLRLIALNIAPQHRPQRPLRPLRLISPSTAPFNIPRLSRLLAACAHLVRCAPRGLGRRVEAHGGEAAAKAAQRRTNARCTPIAHPASTRCGARC